MIKSKKALRRRVTDIIFGSAQWVCTDSEDGLYGLGEAAKFIPRLKDTFEEDTYNYVWALHNLEYFENNESITNHIWEGRKRDD